MKRYLKFIDQAHQINQAFELDYREVKLLDLAAQAHFSGEAICVGDLISQRHLASQATLHKSVKSLVNKQFLAAHINQEDGRHKNISLTKLALDRYKKLHRAINRALT
jgi:DNA-binding MarR family transcriptional regulator